MKLFKAFSHSMALTVMAAGALLAQGGSGGTGSHGRTGHLSSALALTDAQKTQVENIFADERTASKALHQSLRQQEQGIEAAIQAGKAPDEVAQMAQGEGALLGQLAGIHAAAMAKFHGTLTPDQQQKYAGMHRGRGARGAAFQAGAPRGAVK